MAKGAYIYQQIAMTTSEWSSNSTVYPASVWLFEKLSNGKFNMKLTDGSSTFAQLPYVMSDITVTVVKNTDTEYVLKFTTSNGEITTPNLRWASSAIDFVEKNNSVSTLVGIPVDAQSIYAEVTQATSLSLSSALPAGRSISILLKNTSSSETISQPIPSSSPYVNMGASTLSIGPGKYAEINIWAYADGKYCIRTGEML